ncbi:MAG TPA: Pls/PosA family non-ribosomal peptide synthetase [Solirubrobacteraceae bacterium]|nr:Pls/PosA family non-ribosomal peptide synthetase [Solirubrobacteraceae bacterium]
MNPVTLGTARAHASLRDYRGTDAPPASRTLCDGRILIAADDRGVRWRTGERLEHLFEQRVDALAAEGRADAIAVDGPKGPITYAELDARANQLARHLGLRVGVRAGDRVALLLERPTDEYVAMLAVLKLHAAYVPLDVSFPADRVAYIVEDAGARLVITDATCGDRLGQLGSSRFLHLDEQEVTIAGESAARLAIGEVPGPVDELCYAIYTSGTTGRPKGVAIEHASICNFVRVAAASYGVQPGDRMYQGLTLAFDFAVEEIWVAWMVGATLVPKPNATALLGHELHDFLTAQRVTAMCCVPTLLATLEEDLPEIGFLLVSGEACPQDLVDRWHRPGRRMLNTYGPTEATVSATWTVLDRARAVTIGVPLPTYSALVLDPDEDRVLSPGEFGELALGGIGVARGYLNRPDLTGRAFIADFVGLPDNPGDRIYRTGDLVRIGASGEIEHHGRIDTQIKIRGYRIEAGEIEAVLRGVQAIENAIVGPAKSSSGMAELVAYVTCRTGAGPLDRARVYEALDAALPPYMVPTYLEQLDALPLLPSGKPDRHALPAPRNRRPARTGYVQPASETERILAEAVGEVVGVERVSVESHLFEELGTNSLLIARLCARLRAGTALPPVSMRDVYLHPSVRSLAAVLDGERTEPGGAPEWQEPELPEPIGTPRRVLCGALQVLILIIYASLAAALLDVGATWLVGAGSVIEVYLRALAVGAGLLLGMGLLPIVAKWTLIGRFRPQRIRAWSMPYLRFWTVKTLLVTNPLPHLLRDSALYSLYLRALGASVGERVMIVSPHVPVCTDLISLGSDTVILQDAYLNGYRARDGLIEIGPVSVGERAFVGERSVLDIHVAIGDDAQLGHSSSLQAGQSVPRGACWHGSPAQPAPAEYDYRFASTVHPRRGAAARHSAGRLAMLFAIVGPVEAAIGVLALAHPRFVDRLSVLAAPTIAAVILFGGLLASALISLTLPRLLSKLLEPGAAYPVYSWRYSVQRLISRASNNSMLTGLFGDSVMIVGYLRLLGYRFGQIEQTGTNFGLEVKQEVPALSHIGTGTMVSDGLSMMNAQFSSGAFRVLPVKIGRRNYLGNEISFPAGARVGDNCLLATKAMVPIAGPMRSDVGLLGSPSFEIPRTVSRDTRFEAFKEPAERRRRLAAKTRHNIGTMALHLLVYYVLLVGIVLIAIGPLSGHGMSEVAGTAASLLLELVLMLTVFIFAERAVTGFKPLQPRFCSVLERDFWSHERFWKVAPTNYVRIFDGTPLKPLVWRALGVPIGRGVFDDGLAITERTLVKIGDGVTFGMGSHLQSHTLEDGAFKSDLIEVGNGCSIGTGTLVNYGTVLGEGAVLEADSFLIKGSRMEPESRWRGNPAKEVV